MKYHLLTAFSLLLLTVACRTDQFDDTALPGRWELAEGFRDGKESKMLDGLFFEFKPDGQLITNILGEQTSGRYDFDTGKHTISIHSGADFLFAIRKLDKAELILSGNINGSDFKFILHKK